MSASSKTVLVTGGNGYLGSAVVCHFLEHGYKVHTTVRSLAKADNLKAALFPKYSSSLSFFVVQDMTQDGAYEESGALIDVDAILHVASPVPDLNALAPNDSADWVRDMVQPAVDGTFTVLRAASKHTQIKFVVQTSSVAACQDVSALSDPVASVNPLTEADWNPVKGNEADLKGNAFAAYFASKTLAERSAWDYVKEHKPHWTLATFAPPFFYGPAGSRATNPGDFGSSLGLFYMLTTGVVPAFPLDGDYVDVRGHLTGVQAGVGEATEDE